MPSVRSEIVIFRFILALGTRSGVTAEGVREASLPDSPVWLAVSSSWIVSGGTIDDFRLLSRLGLLSAPLPRLDTIECILPTNRVGVGA